MKRPSVTTLIFVPLILSTGGVTFVAYRTISSDTGSVEAAASIAILAGPLFAGIIIAWLLVLFIERRTKKATANLTWEQEQQKIKHDKRVVHWIVPVGLLIFALSCYGIYIMGQSK